MKPNYLFYRKELNKQNEIVKLTISNYTSPTLVQGVGKDPVTTLRLHIDIGNRWYYNEDSASYL